MNSADVDSLCLGTFQANPQRLPQELAAAGLHHQIEPVFAFQFGQWRKRRAEDPYLANCQLLEYFPKRINDSGSRFQIVVSHKDIRHPGKWRVMHDLPKTNFLLIKALVVVLGNELQTVVFRVKGLNQDLTRQVAPSGSARHLTQKLKRSFGTAKVWKSERGIGRKNAHKRDVVEVVAFGNHLSSGQNIGFTPLKLAQDRAVSVTSLGCIAVESGNPSLGEAFFE